AQHACCCQRNSRLHKDPVRASLRAFSYCDFGLVQRGGWSKARGTATIWLDQIGLDSCVDPDLLRLHRGWGKDHDDMLHLVMCGTSEDCTQAKLTLSSFTLVSL